MAILIFDAADARRVAQHAIDNGADCATEMYGEKVVKESRPAIFLVGDEGIYMTSAAKMRDIADPENNPDRAFCAYAKGCNPDTDPDFYDEKRRLWGGDDGAELLQDWPEKIIALCDAGAKQIKVKITATQLAIVEPLAPKKAKTTTITGYDWGKINEASWSLDLKTRLKIYRKVAPMIGDAGAMSSIEHITFFFTELLCHDDAHAHAAARIKAASEIIKALKQAGRVAK